MLRRLTSQLLGAVTLLSGFADVTLPVHLAFFNDVPDEIGSMKS
jgi:hypothetical protein